MGRRRTRGLDFPCSVMTVFASHEKRSVPISPLSRPPPTSITRSDLLGVPMAGSRVSRFRVTGHALPQMCPVDPRDLGIVAGLAPGLRLGPQVGMGRLCLQNGGTPRNWMRFADAIQAWPRSRRAALEATARRERGASC